MTSFPRATVLVAYRRPHGQLRMGPHGQLGARSMLQCGAGRNGMAALQISFCKARIERLVESFDAKAEKQKQFVQELTSMVLAIFSPLSFIVGPL